MLASGQAPRSAREEPQRLCVQAGRTGQCIAGLQTDRPAIKIGEYTTGFAHDHHQRGDIEDVEVRFDDQIDRTARQQVVVQEVAIAADAANAPDGRRWCACDGRLPAARAAYGDNEAPEGEPVRAS